MHIRCPHCHNAIEIVEDSSFRDIPCPSCGSHFNLVGGDAPTESGRGKPRKLAHFELIEQLGVGHFGAVWKAKDTTLDRFVAVKIPRKEQLNEEDVEKFFREARAAAQLRHPSIVSVHEVGRDGNTIFIASDYVEGATLAEWLRGQPLPPPEAAALCAKIADALHAAHEAGVVHRDLKPQNIMVDMQGEPHIMDFGLAKRDTGEITVTIDGALLGTPAYMSPEQAAGKGHEADRRSDVYSLGVILFQALTGELPFRGEKRMLLVQIQRDEPPSSRKLNGRIPCDLDTICLKCLRKEVERRYLTARELADDLRRHLNGESILARPQSSVNRAWRWCRRNPLLATLLGTTTILLMMVSCGSILLARKEFRERAEAESAAREAEIHADRETKSRAAAEKAIKQADESLAIAELLARATTEKAGHSYPEDHPTFLREKLFLSSILGLRGKLAEAEVLCRETWESCRRSLGADHPDTVIAMTQLGMVLLQENKKDQARRILEEAREIAESSLGPDDVAIQAYVKEVPNMIGD